jgi:hypothetical protein
LRLQVAKSRLDHELPLVTRRKQAVDHPQDPVVGDVPRPPLEMQTPDRLIIGVITEGDKLRLSAGL